jgi:hypothetical protein
VSQFPEFDPYCQIVGPAQVDYLPSSPSLSPLTLSYFTTWAFFDVRFVVEKIRRFQGSGMGVYEHGGNEGGRVRLKELVTGDEFICQVAFGSGAMRANCASPGREEDAVGADRSG